MSAKRIGLVGFGHIGRNLYQRLLENYPEIEIGFVYNRSRDKLSKLPGEIILADPETAAGRNCGLIVEMAHPSITGMYGLSFLKCADYMPLSVNGLVDAARLKRLVATAREHGHKLLIPHGALMGCDDLTEWKHMWEAVTITMRKHPTHLNIPMPPEHSGGDAGERVLYDGPVAGIAQKFPRNVNVMVACALATIGVDRCRGRLIADAKAQHATLEVAASGKDGSTLRMVKQAQMVGVSGGEMLESLHHSVLKALGVYQTLDFV